MKLNILHGLAIALIAGIMSIGNAQANGWPTPNISCTEANFGETFDVQYFTQWENLQISYFCNGEFWQLTQVCDLRAGVCFPL